MKGKSPTVARFLCCLLSFVLALAATARADQYCVTIPTGVYRFVGCNLSIASISFPNNFLNAWGNGYFDYYFDPDDLIWLPRDPPPMTRGEGNFIRLASTNQVCFDEPTNAPVLPLNIVPGFTKPVSCQSNAVALFEDIVGRAPVNGTRLYKFLGGYPSSPGLNPFSSPPLSVSTAEWAIYSYTNGVWSPSVPVAAIGEGVGIFQPTAFVYQPTILNARMVNDSFTFELETVYGKAVTIEYSETLPANSWQELTNFTGTGHRRTVTDSIAPGDTASRFYRIRTTQ
jgi:hypothetical protein